MYLQILTNPNHHFIDSSLYKDVILVAWDPAPYSANLNLVSVSLVPLPGPNGQKYLWLRIHGSKSTIKL